MDEDIDPYGHSQGLLAKGYCLCFMFESGETWGNDSETVSDQIKQA